MKVNRLLSLRPILSCCSLICPQLNACTSHLSVHKFRPMPDRPITDGKLRQT